MAIATGHRLWLTTALALGAWWMIVHMDGFRQLPTVNQPRQGDAHDSPKSVNLETGRVCDAETCRQAAGDVLKKETCDVPCMLMPLCESWLPTMRTGCALTPSAKLWRRQARQIARQRGNSGFNVYPYLSTPEARKRQEWAAARLDKLQARRIVDFGAYESPIHQFLTYCPDLVVTIEPLGELATNSSLPYMSKMVPCRSDPRRLWHLINIPASAAEVAAADFGGMRFDAVVCVGCDGGHGPTPTALIGALEANKITSMLIEFSTTYPPSAIFGSIHTMPDSRCSMVDRGEIHWVTSETHYTNRTRLELSCHR